jgi:uncharacterized membrane protein
MIDGTRILRLPRVRWHWLAAAVLAGLLLHIATVLSVVFGQANPAFAKLTDRIPFNIMTVLPAITPGHQLLPFMMPGTRYALCRYDLRKGPVVLRASLGDDTWSIALYTPAGDNVYAISGADLDRREIELLLTATPDNPASPLAAAKDASAAGVTVGLPDRKGVAIISAPMFDPASAGRVESLLLQASCQPRSKAGT